MEIYIEILSGHYLKGGQWNELNFGGRKFFIGSTFVPNFMKIKRGLDFFFDLVWNDPNASARVKY